MPRNTKKENEILFSLFLFLLTILLMAAALHAFASCQLRPLCFQAKGSEIIQPTTTLQFSYALRVFRN